MLTLTSTKAIPLSSAETKQIEQYLLCLGKQDMNALEALYHATAQQIYGFAFSIMKNPHDAQDVLHDCYTTVFTAAASYTPRGKPMAWLFTIARNLCLQKLRQQGRTQEEPLLEYGEEVCAQEQEQQIEDQLLLQACMENLSSVQRQIVVLHAVSGLRHREIAQVLAMPLSTVLSHYHRGIKKCKQFLEGSVNDVK